MAESAARAFGRYLRVLRERQGISLVEACERTERCPEKIDKGTLSRFENGRQVPSAFKLSPLLRIYSIRAEALIERIELDREVERQGKPDTDGLSFEELCDRGREALSSGHRRWEAYAFFRDAIPLAPEAERIGVWSNLTTAIRSLGKNHLALRELQVLRAEAGLSAARRALIDDRIANCQRCLGALDAASDSAESAIAQALQIEDLRILAHAYNSRANIELERGSHRSAIDYLHRAFRAYRDAEQGKSLVLASPAFEVSTLLMLSECYLELHRIGRARATALAAKRLSRRHALPGACGFSEWLLGRVDMAKGATDRAVERWTRAVEQSRDTENHRLTFALEFELYRHALAIGARGLARACRRRLERLAPWIPQHLPTFHDFNRVAEKG